MAKKSTPIRLDNWIRITINIIAGDMQRKTGKAVSANDALSTILEQHFPDEVKAARKLAAEEERTGD